MKISFLSIGKNFVGWLLVLVKTLDSKEEVDWLVREPGRTSRGVSTLLPEKRIA